MLRKLARTLLYLTGAVALLIVLLLGGLWLTAYRALPQQDGFALVQGTKAPVTIVRDAQGVPLITAADEADAYFALGYVHAQDRLFQMELMRRRGQGRLAELVGAPAIGSDRMMRTLGVYRRVEEDLKTLDPETRATFERYTDGVNAWLAEDHPLPIEYTMLWFEPEPWRPADSLVWQKLMGLTLTANWDDELINAALIAKLGPERAAALSPAEDPDAPVTAPSRTALYKTLPLERLYARVMEVVQPTLASNVWVVSGKRTESGAPLLANDPHLGFQSPSIWYFVGLKAPGLNLFGATIPGVPLHLLGHNADIAWGLTTTHSDTSDLFVERLAPSGNAYESPEGLLPFQIREEMIGVRFGETIPLRIRESRHGPIVDDILRVPEGAPTLIAEPYALALSASVLAPIDRSADGVYRMNRATDAESFIDALRLFHAPQQNIMFADRSGAIGYYAPGRVPIRKAGNGMLPVPGWDGSYDWQGWIPFEDLPHVVDPAVEVVINANNRMVDDAYPYLIAAEWPDSYRAQRITDVIAQQPTISMESTSTLQLDVVSLMARELLPLMVARTTPKTPREEQLLDALKTWNGVTDPTQPEPLMFAVWIEHLNARLLSDDLGELMRYFGRVQPTLIRKILTEDQTWCDDRTTMYSDETCWQQVSAAWTDTVAWLGAQNTNAGALRWGDYHVARFGHLLFDNFPFVHDLGALQVSTGGDGFTVNRGSFSSSTASRPFRHFHGSGMRAIYDLGDLTRSRFALAGGQSGHLLSKNYGSLLTAWSEGRYFSAPSERTAVRRLTLQPAP